MKLLADQLPVVKTGNPAVKRMMMQRTSAAGVDHSAIMSADEPAEVRCTHRSIDCAKVELKVVCLVSSSQARV